MNQNHPNRPRKDPNAPRRDPNWRKPIHIYFTYEELDWLLALAEWGDIGDKEDVIPGEVHRVLKRAFEKKAKAAPEHDN